MMDTVIEHYCLSCRRNLDDQTHTETYKLPTRVAKIPLCDICLEFPHKMDMDNIVTTVLTSTLSSSEQQCLMKAMIKNRTDRYRNPKPIIIGLVFLELNAVGGTVLAGRRAETMRQYPGELALLSGHMEEKHGDWRGTLKAEGTEELCVTIDTDNEELVIPQSFDSAGNGKLLLNWALVLPGATTLQAFVPNEETSMRHEIKFHWDTRPKFGIPQHNAIFEQFYQARFF